MSLKRILFALAFVVSTSMFSQKWIDNQVKNEIAKTNKQLAQTSESLKLNEEQTTKVSDIYREFILVKHEKAKEIKDKKELWKALKPQLKVKNNKVKELLSQEQIKALRNAWRNQNK